MAAIAYIIGTLGISSFKISATIFVVMNGQGAPWTLEPSILPGNCVGQLVDKIWMIFNAVIPLVIAYVRCKADYPLEITIGMKETKFVGGEGIETQPLRTTAGGSGSRTKYESVMDA